MFLTAEEVFRATTALRSRVHPFFGISFLTFKRHELPVGTTAQVVFSKIAAAFMDLYYRPARNTSQYFVPLRSSKGADVTSNRWHAPRYPSTSLQRITAETFREAFLHPKNSSEWGFRSDYVVQLRRLQDEHQGDPTPAFELAAWLFRNDELPIDASPQSLTNRLLNTFRITPAELALFDLSLPAALETSASPSEDELLARIGSPKGPVHETGAGLDQLRLIQVGPACDITYEPSPRLNLITGDNALGKTFLLDAAYLGLTGCWASQPLHPRADSTSASIEVGVQTGGSSTTARYSYRWNQRRWAHPAPKASPGVVVYARYDGAFAVWDRAARPFAASESRPGRSLLLTPEEVWSGVPIAPGRPELICRGLLADWSNWRLDPKQEVLRTRFEKCVARLSPDQNTALSFGDSRTLPGDAREVFTLRMPYGHVPATLVSAGIRRVLAMAYILVWAWDQHTRNSAELRLEPDRRVVLLFDEIEAHLHPRWQRVIVPSLLEAITGLVDGLSPQVHLATHSPLVLASSEPAFDDELDALHHLRFEPSTATVELDRLEYVRRGRADLWLNSEVFDYTPSRSVEAELAIERANELQRPATNASAAEVNSAHTTLVNLLAPDDEYWPRWLSFARRFSPHQ